jgi:hypothetical protein
MPQFEIVTTAQREDLHEQFATAFKRSWPEFIFHDAITHQFTAAVQERYARNDVTVISDNHVVAGGWGITLAWINPWSTSRVVTTTHSCEPSQSWIHR